MSKRSMIFAALVIGLAAGTGLVQRASAGEPSKTVHRAIFHVNIADEARWQEVLTNVENVQKAFGVGNVEIEVVAHGAGLGLLKASNAALRERIERIEKTGPVFAACNNTLQKQSLTVADLTPGVKVIDSGVAELIRKQEAGWSYVKLGF